MEIVDCPECGIPAEIEESSWLDSTSGPVEHLKIRCLRRHWFLVPRDRLPAASHSRGDNLQVVDVHGGRPVRRGHPAAD